VSRFATGGLVDDDGRVFLPVGCHQPMTDRERAFLEGFIGSKDDPILRVRDAHTIVASLTLHPENLDSWRKWAADTLAIEGVTP